jgi:hypothetical protein
MNGSTNRTSGGSTKSSTTFGVGFGADGADGASSLHPTKNSEHRTNPTRLASLGEDFERAAIGQRSQAVLLGASSPSADRLDPSSARRHCPTRRALT